MKNERSLARKQGFSLIEVMVALSVGTLVISGVLTAFIFFIGSAARADAWALADRNASFAVERMLRPSDASIGLRNFNSSLISVTNDPSGWTISESLINGYVYSRSEKTIKDLMGSVIAKDVVDATVTNRAGYILLSVDIEAGLGRNRSTNTCATAIYSRNS